jgi:SAM-dependent methyltransferase
MSRSLGHTRPSQHTARRSAKPNRSVSAFFQCIECGSALTFGPTDKMKCTQCRAAVPVIDGINDFVGGASTTQLDNIDYDQFYGINEEHSSSLFQLVKRSAGPLWFDDFGNALEIGCGTGGFSLALLHNISRRHVVLTDVSIKMLRLCQDRLCRIGHLPREALTFATYSGTEACFRPESFDTCFGTAVVHHITDVRDFLAQVHSLLKPGGHAFFMEPNLAFHRALTATTADVAAELVRDAQVSETDLHRILNWMAEVHCNVVNSGDTEILAEREDKHLFVAEVFEDWARAAGFGRATALPCDMDPTGWNTIQVYLGQCAISAQALEMVEKQWRSMEKRHFGSLGAHDQSPSYLFWLQKIGPSARRSRAARGRPDDVAGTVEQPPRKLWLDIQASRNGQGVEVFVTGWCLAGEPVRAIQITSGGAGRRLPIWRPRPDVHTRMNGKNEYPPLHALCSGIEGRVRLEAIDANQDRIRLTIHVVMVDGRLMLGGVASPTLDGNTFEMHLG